MGAGLIAAVCIAVFCIAIAVIYEYLPKRADGAGSLLLVFVFLACGATLVGVLMGYVVSHRMLGVAIGMFVLAATLLALGIKTYRHMLKTSH